MHHKLKKTIYMCVCIYVEREMYKIYFIDLKEKGSFI